MKWATHSARERLLGKISPCLSFVNRRTKRGGEKEEYELTFTLMASVGEVGCEGLPVVPALLWGSQGCPGEPSSPSASNRSGYHSAKG